MRPARSWLYGLALVLTTALAYQPAWQGKPIWDDEIHLTSTELSSVHGLAQIWTEPAAVPQYYPLLHTVFWAENKLWGHWPLPYHLVNIALHILTAFLILRILQRLELPGAWLAAGIFALHPVMVESVAWISELKNTLSGALGASSALIYLKFDRDRKRTSYFMALGLFLAAILTKTVVVTLPAVLLIIFWWKRGTVKRDWAPLVPFFLISLLAGLVTVWVEQRFCVAHGETFNFTITERFLIAGRLFWFYAGKIMWPATLMLIYPAWDVRQSDWSQYLFLAAALILLFGLWVLRKQSRGPFAAALCFVVMLSPVLGFFNLSYFMSGLGPDHHAAIFRSDHFQYLSVVAVVAPISAGIVWLISRMNIESRPAMDAASLGLFVLLAAMTWAQSATYRDPETCLRAVIAKNPNSATARSNLGGALLNQGAIDEATTQLRQAIEIEPDLQFAHYNLGVALLRKNEIDEAISHLRTALKLDPNYPKAYYTLGSALSKKGEVNEAAIAYQRALQLQPNFPDAHTNLANLLLEKGETERALDHYRMVSQLQPNDPGAHYNLAVGLTRNGEVDRAIAELKTALQLDPKYPDAEPLLRNLVSRRVP